MKIIKLISFPLLMLTLITGFISLESCNPIFPGRTKVYKPNIYIYPTESIQLNVNIDFPAGGDVVTSIPEYEKGWDISVDTNGLIDEEYSYLFYESTQPDVWQRNQGWIIERADLEQFFRNNMEEFGFIGREIQDFIEYWIPRFEQYEYYVIYPQSLDIILDVIELNFSIIPDYSLRLFYVVKGINQLNDNEIKSPPIMNDFSRTGFHVTEWGVVLD